MEPLEPPTGHAPATLRPRIAKDAAVTRLSRPPEMLLRKHKAGIELLIKEGCRTTDLLALAAQELEGDARPALRPGR